MNEKQSDEQRGSGRLAAPSMPASPAPGGAQPAPAAPAVIETSALTKTYGHQIRAVERLDLTIRQGEVYGLLGPNGAGKTTTLRMLLGLVRPTSGSGTLLGMPLGSAIGLARVGALVESPAFYPHLSGRANLQGLAVLARVEPARVDAVLRQVDLAERADDRFATYSLGMKQRLGVAAALLKDPQVLVLDEPTNGLDPQGRVDMRALVRSLGQGDRTVVVSSHLLDDVEQVCDRVGVLQRGRLIAEKTVAELRGPRSLLVRAAPEEQARRLLEEAFPGQGVVRRDGAFLIATDPAVAPQVARRLVLEGIQLAELRAEQNSLEAVFLELTGADSDPKEVR